MVRTPALLQYYLHVTFVPLDGAPLMTVHQHFLSVSVPLDSSPTQTPPLKDPSALLGDTLSTSGDAGDS